MLDFKLLLYYPMIITCYIFINECFSRKIQYLHLWKKSNLILPFTTVKIDRKIEKYTIGSNDKNLARTLFRHLT